MYNFQKGFRLLPVLLVILLVGAVAGASWYVWDRQKNDIKPAITNFDECVAAGNPVMESYPEQCAANGQSFTNPRQQVEQPALE